MSYIRNYTQYIFHVKGTVEQNSNPARKTSVVDCNALSVCLSPTSWTGR